MSASAAARALGFTKGRGLGTSRGGRMGSLHLHFAKIVQIGKFRIERVRHFGHQVDRRRPAPIQIGIIQQLGEEWTSAESVGQMPAALCLFVK